MISHRELTFEDYLAILRRRLWLILIPAVLGPAIGYGISRLLRTVYTSRTLVLVEQQKVPERYVASVVTDDLNERLATMKEQILSRRRLEPIIEKFALYKEDQGSVPMEDLVDRLRGSIGVTPVEAMSGTRPGVLPGFYISFTAENARLTQQVCAEITSMFMEQNLRIRELRAQGTTDFIAKQLEEAKHNLDEQDAKLAAFKRRNIGQLPGEEQTSLNILTGFNTQLEGVIQAIGRAQSDKTYMNSLLAQALSVWQASKAQGNPETLQQQLSAMRADLIKLEAKYTKDHPDVKRLQDDVAQLEKKINESAAATKDKPEDKDSKGAAQEPPQVQQLRAQIYLADQTIKEKTREQERLQAEIQALRARIQLTPTVEQQFKEVTRDYQTALEFYNDLLKNRNQSEMATDLERRQQGEQFQVMDPANLPDRPSFPNRQLFAAGGLGGGLALGLGLALMMELRDKAIRTDRDVEALLGLPTLTMVPVLALDEGKSHAFWKRSAPRLEKPGHMDRA